MMSFAAWGNALYRGEKSYPIIHKRRIWISVGVTLIVLAIAALGIRGINPSIEFSGGSQFSIVSITDNSSEPAYQVMKNHSVPAESVRVSQLGANGLRVQSAQVDPSDTRQIAQDLADAYKVEASNVDATNIGPSWGGEVTRKAANSLVIFLVLVGLLMAVYFKSWQMSFSALFALFHDIFITAGFFALTQVEVSPATVIGFLTILAYSLYDTVVVFDRVRELTASYTAQSRYTYAELVNLAVNQTLVRSINTSIVALLPVGAILFLGALLLGAGTLTDISLALFVGMIAGTLSSIFIAPSMLVLLQGRSAKSKQHTERVRASRNRGSAHLDTEDAATRAGSHTAKDADLDDSLQTVPVMKPGRHLGQAAQPQRKKRKKNR